ncbi:transporter substrate-binding domain-containing protein [Peptoclostridium litorale]|uniref:transporter substrate-binding domain-containing protein n=1 Tax=Peptoclostridium litorale TaxID=1557 RepID=UPI000980F8F2
MVLIHIQCIVNPPYSFVDTNGRPAGFNIELVQAIAKVMDIDMVFKLDEWKDVRASL